MTTQMIRSRTNMLRLLFLICCWVGSQRAFVDAKLENVTIDDTDSSIVYLPADAWHSNSSNCTSCLNPSAASAYQNSFHDGTRPSPGLDPDDTPSSTASNPAATSAPPRAPDLAAPAPPNQPATPPQTVQPEQSAQPEQGNGKKDNDGDGGNDADEKKKGSNGGRSLKRRFLVRVDADDFADAPVTAKFNFTGSSVYLFCLMPLQTPATDGPPTAMNLSFTLDNSPAGIFTHNGSQGAIGYQSNVSVFSMENLAEAPHTLLVDVGEGSVFLFDYMVYTHNVEDPAAPTTAQPAPSPTEDPNVKKHNVATFGGAVGGSVGVLAIISLGVAVSIIRRRRAAARRDRLADTESTASDDSPHMSGPTPFVPRFFPGTIIPTDPPPYLDSLASSSTHHLVSARAPIGPLVPLLSAPRRNSYANVPPASPPPPLDDMLLVPPPPFPVAITAPSPIGLSDPLTLSGAPSPPAANGDSHPSQSVGDDNPDFSESSADEHEPLTGRSRPHSRASFRELLTAGQPHDPGSS